VAVLCCLLQVRVASVDWIKIIAEDHISLMVMTCPFIMILFCIQDANCLCLFRKEAQKIFKFWLVPKMDKYLEILRCFLVAVFSYII
jgi:hypothetical protein